MASLSTACLRQRGTVQRRFRLLSVAALGVVNDGFASVGRSARSSQTSAIGRKQTVAGPALIGCFAPTADIRIGQFLLNGPGEAGNRSLAVLHLRLHCDRFRAGGDTWSAGTAEAR